MREKIRTNARNIVLYGLTPPRCDASDEKIKNIASIQKQRLSSSLIDGLVLYDLQDESARNSEQRTFAFKDTISPDSYYKEHLSNFNAVIYKAVGKHDENSLKSFLESDICQACVFVGASSKTEQGKTTLKRAYELKASCNSNIALGGICIPERHAIKGDEHERVCAKIASGCEFFISQAVFNLKNAKAFLKDFARLVSSGKTKAVPIIFTFTPCGDAKTLSFMRWLGIDVPSEFAIRLLHSSNPLEMSVLTAFDSFCELKELGAGLGISVGANVESISAKKTEIQASIELLNKIIKAGQ